MYTIVLMAALTTNSQAPDFGRYRAAACHGCYGCAGCHGCAGCYGGYAGHGSYASYGAYAGYGGYGYYAGDPWGCFGCHGCYGCYGGWSCYGAVLPHHGYRPDCPEPYQVADPKKDIEETPLPKERDKKKKKGKGADDDEVSSELPRANVTIEVPAGARLFVDGRPVRVTGTTQAFRTPVLVEGREYFYDVRVEVERDGRTVSDTRQVTFRAGQDVTVSFGTATVQR